MGKSPELGMLTEIEDLRSVWPNEATDFTPWLARDSSMRVLSDAVGLDLSVDETESSVGDFSVDILATEMQGGKKVVIENQLEDTDHDHLGKLITYASGKDASVVIWVVKHAREEHKSAVAWLNAHTDDDASFFLCEVKLYRIGDSKIAPMFVVVERPNDWAREQHSASKAVTSTMQERRKWWEAFNEHAVGNRTFSKAFGRRKPSTDHWMSLYLNTSLCHVEILQQRRDSQLGVELRIPDNKGFFQFLLGHREEIEAAYGGPLQWMEQPDIKASRVLGLRDLNYDDKEAMTGAFDWAMEKSLAIREAVLPLVKAYGKEGKGA